MFDDYYRLFDGYYRLVAAIGLARLSVFLRRTTGRDVYERRGEWSLWAMLLVLRVVVNVGAAVATAMAVLSPTLRERHADMFLRDQRVVGSDRRVVGSDRRVVGSDQPRDTHGRGLVGASQKTQSRE